MSIAPPEVYNRVIFENARLRALNAELVDRWSAYHDELDRRAAQVADLRALNAELMAAADMARICLKNRDQNDLETKALVALRAAIAKAKGEK